MIAEQEEAERQFIIAKEVEALEVSTQLEEVKELEEKSVKQEELRISALQKEEDLKVAVELEETKKIAAHEEVKKVEQEKENLKIEENLRVLALEEENKIALHKEENSRIVKEEEEEALRIKGEEENSRIVKEGEEHSLRIKEEEEDSLRKRKEEEGEALRIAAQEEEEKEVEALKVSTQLEEEKGLEEKKKAEQEELRILEEEEALRMAAQEEEDDLKIAACAALLKKENEEANRTVEASRLEMIAEQEEAERQFIIAKEVAFLKLEEEKELEEKKKEIEQEELRISALNKEANRSVEAEKHPSIENYLTQEDPPILETISSMTGSENIPTVSETETVGEGGGDVPVQKGTWNSWLSATGSKAAGIGIGMAAVGWDATRATIAKKQDERAEMQKYSKAYQMFAKEGSSVEININAGCITSIPFFVPKGKAIVWKVLMKGLEINFGVKLRVQEVGGAVEHDMEDAKKITAGEFIIGDRKCLDYEDRRIALILDNSQGKLWGKTLTYRVNVGNPVDITEIRDLYNKQAEEYMLESKEEETAPNLEEPMDRNVSAEKEDKSEEVNSSGGGGYASSIFALSSSVVKKAQGRVEAFKSTGGGYRFWGSKPAEKTEEENTTELVPIDKQVTVSYDNDSELEEGGEEEEFLDSNSNFSTISLSGKQALENEH